MGFASNVTIILPHPRFREGPYLLSRDFRTRVDEQDMGENPADRTEQGTMGGEDLTAFDASRLRCGTKTLTSNGKSNQLRKFDQDTTLLTSVILSLVLVAAAVLGCEELVQKESVRLTVTDTVRATDQPQETQLATSTPPEASYHPVETPASNPSSPRAPSSQLNPIDTQITASQRSAEPVEELAGAKSKSPTHRTSMHHKVSDVKIRLLMLWHASLSRSRQQARSGNAFWRFNDHHWRSND